MKKIIREVISAEDFPEWVEISNFIKDKLKFDSDNMNPWVFSDKKFIKIVNSSVADLYSSRSLFAFAFRLDSDDIACFEENKPGKVVIIHNREDPGFEEGPEFISFEAWYNYALNSQNGEHSYENIPGIDFNPDIGDSR